MRRTKLEILDSRYDNDRMPSFWEYNVVGEDRRDTYAENLIGQSYFQDEGCHLAESCLRCPFSTCRKLSHTEERMERNAAVWRDFRRMERKGETRRISKLAKKYGISSRTVSRIIEKGRAGDKFEMPRPEQQKSFREVMVEPFFKERLPLPVLPVSY